MPGSSRLDITGTARGLVLIPVSRTGSLRVWEHYTGSLHPCPHAKALLIHNPIREVHNPIREVLGQKQVVRAYAGEKR